MLLTALIVTGCERDDVEVTETTPQEGNVTISLGTRGYVEGTVGTRALPSGYHEYGNATLGAEETTHPSIYAFMPKADHTEVDNRAKGVFTWNSHPDPDNGYTWKSALTIDAGETFVYGFMPSIAASSKTIVPRVSTFADGAVMTITCPSATTGDLCYISGVARETTSTFDIVDDGNTTVNRGTFSFTPITSEDNNLYVLMDHLYAKMSLTFRVEPSNETPEHYPDGYYYNLRRIKLKRVTMTTSIGTETITITYNASAGTTAVEYGGVVGATEQEITLYHNSDGEEITPAGLHIPAFFVPLGAGDEKAISITSTYDVYYRDPSANGGNPIRQDCEATNAITLCAPEGKTLGAGKMVNYTATVTPSYLYVLGDADLDNPTIVVN